MAIELVKLIDGHAGFDPDRDLMLTTFIQLGIRAYVRVPDGLKVISRGLAVDPEQGIAPNHAGMFVLVGHPECRYIALEERQLAEIVTRGFIICSEFRSELLLEASEGLIRRQPLMSYLVHESGMGAFAPPPKFDDADLDPMDQMTYRTDGVPERMAELLNPRDATFYAGDLCLFPEDAELAHDQASTLAANDDPWGHRRNAPAVSLVYRAAKHFSSDREYSFAAAERWIREHDTYGVFVGKSKALAYAARLINRTPKFDSLESDEILDTEKICINELGRDYRDPVCSKRLSLLLLATDIWLEHSKREVGKLLPLDGLEGYLYELGFKRGDEKALFKKRKQAGKPGGSRSAVDRENPCSYLASIISAMPHDSGVVAEPQNSAH